MIFTLPAKQFLAALTAFAFGFAAGLPALLYRRKSGKLERVLTDFAATVSLAVLYLLSCEIGSEGCLVWYTPFTFLSGTALFLRARTLLSRLRILVTRRKTEK